MTENAAKAEEAPRLPAGILCLIAQAAQQQDDSLLAYLRLSLVCKDWQHCLAGARNFVPPSAMTCTLPRMMRSGVPHMQLISYGTGSDASGGICCTGSSLAPSTSGIDCGVLTSQGGAYQSSCQATRPHSSWRGCVPHGCRCGRSASGFSRQVRPPWQRSGSSATCTAVCVSSTAYPAGRPSPPRIAT